MKSVKAKIRQFPRFYTLSAVVLLVLGLGATLSTGILTKASLENLWQETVNPSTQRLLFSQLHKLNSSQGRQDLKTWKLKIEKEKDYSNALQNSLQWEAFIISGQNAEQETKGELMHHMLLEIQANEQRMAYWNQMQTLSAFMNSGLSAISPALLEEKMKNEETLIEALKEHPDFKEQLPLLETEKGQTEDWLEKILKIQSSLEWGADLKNIDFLVSHNQDQQKLIEILGEETILEADKVKPLSPAELRLLNIYIHQNHDELIESNRIALQDIQNSIEIASLLDPSLIIDRINQLTLAEKQILEYSSLESWLLLFETLKGEPLLLPEILEEEAVIEPEVPAESETLPEVSVGEETIPAVLDIPAQVIIETETLPIEPEAPAESENLPEVSVGEETIPAVLDIPAQVIIETETLPIEPEAPVIPEVAPPEETIPAVLEEVPGFLDIPAQVIIETETLPEEVIETTEETPIPEEPIAPPEEILPPDPIIAELADHLSSLNETLAYTELTIEFLNRNENKFLRQKEIDDFVADIGLSEKNLSLWNTMLNKALTEMSYYEKLEGFRGFVGVLKFGKECEVKGRTDFCLEATTDLSTKTLINEKNIRPTEKEEHQFEKPGVSLSFANDEKRTLEITYLKEDPEKEETDSEKSIEITYQDTKEPQWTTESNPEDPETKIHETPKEPVFETFQIVHEKKEGEIYAMQVVETEKKEGIWSTPADPKEASQDFVVYSTDDLRKSDIYKYSYNPNTLQPNQIKNFTIYNFGEGEEEEIYTFNNAVLRANQAGQLEGYYLPLPDLNIEVSSSLLARATTFLASEEAKALHENGRENPDFIVQAPFALNAENEVLEGLTYEITGDNFNQLKVKFSALKEEYPLVLDPSIILLAPGVTSASHTFTGTASNYYFGYSSAFADFNADGKKDLAIGAGGIAGSNNGRVYIFYSDGTYPAFDSNADVTLYGSIGEAMGKQMAAGDLNSDGRPDLVVSAGGNNGGVGALYIFYNDGSWPSDSSTADITILGESLSYFGDGGIELADFNNDGILDIATAGSSYGTNQGRVYLLYNDGTWPNALTADVTITGGAGEYAGNEIESGDFNGDGTTDLAIGASAYTTNTGRVYLIYNDGAYPSLTNSADVTITGEATSNAFGYSLKAGDFNNDTKEDLAVGAYEYNSTQGRVYLFYNDGTYPAGAASADHIITGENGSFGIDIGAGDVNADNKTDLLIGASLYSSAQFAGTGRVYIFHNDGTYPSSAADADAKNDGESGGYGAYINTGDINEDGAEDILISNIGYNTGMGRTYLYFSEGGSVIDANGIAGESASNFGYRVKMDDFTGDGLIDLAIGAYGYNSSQGRVYLFANKGNYPNGASAADVIITGQNTGDRFGINLGSADLNGDGRKDLVVAADQYGTNAGRIYGFYNDGSIPTAAASADHIIDGEAGSKLGDGEISGDFNLLISATQYNSGDGRAYLFYLDGTVPTSAASADVIFTGETGSQFGTAGASADFNKDGLKDLAISAYGYSSNQGRVYLFYQPASGGFINTAAISANAIITGNAASGMGATVKTADINGDNFADLITSADLNSSNQGAVYIYYQPSGSNFSAALSALNANILFNGESSSRLGSAKSIITGDFNQDAVQDIAMGAFNANSGKGRTYIYHSPSNLNSSNNVFFAPTIISGDSGSALGIGIDSGDLDNDGMTDLVIGAGGHNTNIGAAFLLYGQNKKTWLTPVSHQATVQTEIGLMHHIRETFTEKTRFGQSVAVGDFNGDGAQDLAVGAPHEVGFSSGAGKVYLFLNDQNLPETATGADVILTGNAGDLFGYSLAVGKVSTISDTYEDLVIGAPASNSNTGAAYLFIGRSTWNSSYAYTQAEAAITGENGNDLFGHSLLAKTDLSPVRDGKTDIVIGAPNYPSGTANGAVYIFENDGSYPTSANGANVLITGESGSQLGYSLASADVSQTADGRDDLIAGAPFYNTSSGRAYIFYNDGSYPLTANVADILLTGAIGDNLGKSLATGEISATRDNRIDILAGAPGYSSDRGRVYGFYNDGIYGAADITISGSDLSEAFGTAIVTGDFNRDGRSDFAVSSPYKNNNKGQIYIFENDGAYPATASSAEKIISGLTRSNMGLSLATGDLDGDNWEGLVIGGYNSYTSNSGQVMIADLAALIAEGENATDDFGYAVATGDLSGDGLPDLAIGAPAYSTNTGRVYVFYNGSTLPDAATAPVIITGQSSGDLFGSAIAIGNINGEASTDLVVGAYANNKVYLFLNDGTLPSLAANADSIITGDSGSGFGKTITIGEVSTTADTLSDIVIGAPNHTTNTGRVYIFNGRASWNSTYTASTDASTTLSGSNTSDLFGSALLAETDLSATADNKTDLVIGAPGAGSNNGAAYIFYNDGSYTTANISLAGANAEKLGSAFTSGEFSPSPDGRMDLAIGAIDASNGDGAVYIYLNDGSYSTADKTIIGENSASLNGDFGQTLKSFDWNHDGLEDLIVGDPLIGTSTGRVSIFTGSASGFASSVKSAEFTMNGESTSANYGFGMDSADFNSDGKTDLIIGAHDSSRAYLYEGRNSASRLGAPTIDLHSINGIDGDISAPYWDSVGPNDTAIYLNSGNGIECRISNSALTNENFAEATLCSESIYDTTNGHYSNCSITGLTDSSAYTYYLSCKTDNSLISSLAINSLTFGLDNTTPSAPIISSTSHPSVSTYYNDNSIDFTWTDGAAGPSPATYYYCIDTANTCLPVAEDADRIVAGAGLQEGTNYIRAKACDLYGCSSVTSFTALVDTSIPAAPSISCSGFVTGVFAQGTSTTCTWNDTTGPSAGTYAYCTDSANTCTPSGNDIDRSVLLSGITTGHTYFRVKTTDVAGSSSIVSFDIASDQFPVLSTMATDDGTPSNTIEPNDVITFRGTISDADAGATVSMVICSSGSTFVSTLDPCNGGTVYCSSLNQIPGTLTCQGSPTLSNAPAAHGNYDYKVFVYDDLNQLSIGTEPSSQTWTVTDTAPYLTTFVLNNINFTLTAGSTAAYTWNGTYTDLNGDLDVTASSGKVFDAAATTSACLANSKNCYIPISCTFSNQSTAGSGKLTTGVDTDASLSCSINMYFNANASSSWTGVLTIGDGSTSDTENTSVGTVAALQGVDTRTNTDVSGPFLDFGTLGVGQNTGINNEVFYIANTGNIIIDSQILGTVFCSSWNTAYSNCGGSTIAVSKHKYSLIAFDYATGGTALNGSNQCMNTNIPVRTTPTDASGNAALYIGIEIPSNTTAGNYSSQMTLSSIDICN